MKKVICILICGLLLLSLAACGQEPVSNVTGSADTSAEPEGTQTPEETETPEETGKPDVGTDGTETSIDLAALYEEGMASYGDKDIEAPFLFPETDQEFLDNFYHGIKDVELKQFYVAMAPVTNAPMEIALVEVANEADVQTMINIFQARIDECSGDGFYTEEAAIWKNNARVTSRGCYVFLAVMTDDYGIPEAFILD